MSDEVVIKIGGLIELMKKFSDMQKDSIKSDTLFESGQFLSGWIKQHRLSGPRPRFLGVRSGRLYGSINYSKPKKVGDTWQGSVSTNMVYAKIHEYGGTIRHLAQSRRTFFKEYKSGFREGMVLFSSKKKATFEQWTLRKQYSVKIPARPFMRPAIDDKGNQQQFVDILAENIQKEWAK